MPPERPWKADAVLRLFASVIVCVFIGTLAVSVVQHFSGPEKAPRALFLSLASGGLALFVIALWIMRRAWSFERFTRNFVGLVATTYIGLSLLWWCMHLAGDADALEGSTWKIVISVLSFQGAALLLVWRFLREHELGWREAFGLDRRTTQAILVGLGVGASLLPICLGLQMVSGSILEVLRVPVEEQHAVQVLRLAESWSNRLILAVTAILLVPVAEEILFRGILYPAIKNGGYPRLALWGVSAVFAAIHLNVATFAPLFLLALVLTWLYEKSNNLLAPIAAHSLFNTLNFALLYILKHKLDAPGQP